MKRFLVLVADTGAVVLYLVLSLPVVAGLLNRLASVKSLALVFTGWWPLFGSAAALFIAVLAAVAATRLLGRSPASVFAVFIAAGGLLLLWQVGMDAPAVSESLIDYVWVLGVVAAAACAFLPWPKVPLSKHLATVAEG